MEADIAVHSLKDLPMHLSEEFMIGAIGKREDARDAFISNDFEISREAFEIWH